MTAEEAIETEFEPAVMDDDDAAARDMEERLARVFEWFGGVFHVLVAYQDNQRTAEELRMSTRVMALACGFTLAAGAETPAELARLIGRKKATVGKCLNGFIEKNGLPTLPGQRNASARAHMRAARLRQVMRNGNSKP
jgi:hypothetical protein